MFASVISQAGELGITAFSPQIVNYYFFFFSFLTGESKSVPHFQETQNMLLLTLLSNSILIHSFLQELYRKYFFPRASPDATASSHIEMTPLQCNVCHFVIPYFIMFPVLQWARASLLPRHHMCRLSKLSWQQDLFSCSLCLFFTRW